MAVANGVTVMNIDYNYYRRSVWNRLMSKQ